MIFLENIYYLNDFILCCILLCKSKTIALFFLCGSLKSDRLQNLYSAIAPLPLCPLRLCGLLKERSPAK